MGLRQTIPYYQNGLSIWHIERIRVKTVATASETSCRSFQTHALSHFAGRYMLRVLRSLEWGKEGTTPVDSRKQIPRTDDSLKRRYSQTLSSLGYKAEDCFPTAWMLNVLEYHDETRMGEFQDQEDGLKKNQLERETVSSADADMPLRARCEKFIKGKSEGRFRLRHSLDVVGREGNSSLSNLTGPKVLWIHTDEVIDDDNASGATWPEKHFENDGADTNWKSANVASHPPNEWWQRLVYPQLTHSDHSAGSIRNIVVFFCPWECYDTYPVDKGTRMFGAVCGRRPVVGKRDFEGHKDPLEDLHRVGKCQLEGQLEILPGAARQLQSMEASDPLIRHHVVGARHLRGLLGGLLAGTSERVR